MRAGELKAGVEGDGDIGIALIVFAGGIGRDASPGKDAGVECALAEEELLIGGRLPGELVIAAGTVDETGRGGRLAQGWLLCGCGS